jgi:UDP-glucose 4-epimerase
VRAAIGGEHVLVTGAAGFIGRHLVDALLRDGARVRALSGPPGHGLPSLPADVTSIDADISTPGAAEEAVGDARIVVHAAGPASVAASFTDPASFVRIHTEGTARLLDACRRADVRRVVFISSAEVYGRPRANPVREGHPQRARSPYGAAKAGAEQMVRAFADAYGLEAVILRPFSVYGPGQTAASLIGTVLRQAAGGDAAGGDAVRLHDLRPVRDYVFVRDVADAVLAACTAPIKRTGVFNVGSGRGTSVARLASLILQAAGRTMTVEQDGTDRPGRAQILRLVADPARARDHLGWTAATSLPDGLAATVHAMQEGRAMGIGTMEAAPPPSALDVAGAGAGA